VHKISGFVCGILSSGVLWGAASFVLLMVYEWFRTEREFSRRELELARTACVKTVSLATALGMVVYVGRFWWKYFAS
jgi:hypothetical protein